MPRAGVRETRPRGESNLEALTPEERRGALVLVALLLIGALWDLGQATWPRYAAVPGTPRVAVDPADTAAIAAAIPVPSPAAAGAGEPAGPVVDLNRADARELDALPGIGPVLAERILQCRARIGSFRSPEDLLAVPGIGPRLLERLKPRVRCGKAAAPPG